MTKKIFNVLTIMAFVVAFTSCKKKADEAKTAAAEEAATAEATSTKYMVNPDESVIAWKGSKPTGSTHNGTINLESGVFTVNDGKLESGTFLIDMSSIKNLDIPADKEGNAKLVGHLKSPDFFDVEKYKTAVFTVTGSEKVDGKLMLSGNLKMKEKTNNITVPVTMSSDADGFTLTSETFTIDRSKWDVQYGSGSFFDNLGDKLISDDIELKVTVKAKKS